MEEKSEIDVSYVREPVERQLLVKELKERHFLRKTNYGNKEIYVTTAHRSPNLMQEIGRLRELSFALQGGGTGNTMDIDEYDLLPEPYCYKQLFVWSPEDEEIVGAYRFIHGTNMMVRGDGTFATSAASEFQYSEEFVKEYLPYTVELGRAFVQPAFQPGTNLRKGMYSLDNLWDGLGCLAMEIPETRYFFGKITMYSQMNARAKDMILYFYQKHFPDKDGLMWPYEPREVVTDYNELHKMFSGRNYKEDYQTLVRNVRELGTSVPPLVNAYMNLSSTMRTFGTAMTKGFGGVDETGIMVTLRDLYPEKRSRYFESYEAKNEKFDRRRLFKINMKRTPWWRRKNDDERQELEALRQMKSEHPERKKRETVGERIKQARERKRKEKKNGSKKS
ncbi:MAG: GNAT family N-acetyltransferase [Bacteroidales bacterium]|nr:GNAT family N-acetyltransferase [Bacteroidales bacterium]